MVVVLYGTQYREAVALWAENRGSVVERKPGDRSRESQHKRVTR